MAKYQTKCYNGQRPLVLPDDASAEWVAVDVEFSATAPAGNDLYQLCKIPPGYLVTDWVLNFPDIDSGGGALRWSLGVENSGGTDLGTEVWGTALTAGSDGLVSRATLNASASGDITAERTITLKCTTAATTWAGSGKVGKLLMQLQG